METIGVGRRQQSQYDEEDDEGITERSNNGIHDVALALKSMNKGEMYDVIAKLKELADTNPDEARRLLTQHPQFVVRYTFTESQMRAAKSSFLQ